MKSEKEKNLRRSRESKNSARKPYESPKITVHGTIEKITEGIGEPLGEGSTSVTIS